MASSSSSSGNPQGEKYEVFISFRGADVRYGFLSHVVAALRRKQIKAFMDDTDLERGNEITPTLLKIIEQSKISIVIFSKYYPSSAWCLDELEKILDCKENRKQTVVPVFYHVDPSDIQELQGNYAITKHTQQFSPSKVENWKRALVEISQLSGFDSDNYMCKPEANLCDEIANYVDKKLSDLFPINMQKDRLFGIDSRLEDVELLIEPEANGVRMVGIWGMGGIGKTTLAEKVFNKIKNKFDGCSFVPNVREKLNKKLEIKDLRDDIIREVLGDKDIKIGSPHTIDDSIQRRLKDRKVHIVLDDVDNCRQLKSLLEDSGLCSPGMFGSKSRIIVTSRDKQVLESVNMEKRIYHVKRLSDYEALQLFRWHGFRQCYPQQEYKELSEKVVHYCHGLPLALIVLGSELKGKKREEWEAALEKFGSIPHADILTILRTSFDGLDRDEKNIFLDIACFFKGEYAGNVERMLECFGFHAKNGMNRLCDKSLITKGFSFEMHDLLQQMGQEIVVEQSGEQHENQSRLWRYKDIRGVLTSDGGTENVEAISLNVKEIDDYIDISSKAFLHMRKLRFLRVIYFYYSYASFIPDKAFLREGLEFLPNSLKYLEWQQYPLSSLPSNFNLENLVELHMPCSRLEQLIWNKPLRNLKRICLNNSENLKRIFDLAKAPNLEVINLRDCKNLIDIGSFMGYLNKLTTLCLDGCVSLYQLPGIPSSVKKLNLSRSGIRQLPLTIGHHQSFLSLHSNLCPNFTSHPNTICNLRSLKSLDISFCKSLKKLPEHLGNLQSLEYLNSSRIGLEELPSSICNLRSLRFFDIFDCKSLNRLPEHFGNLQSLEYLNASRTGLEELPSSICNLRSLTDLDISYCESLNKLPEHLGNLQSLKRLGASETGLEELPSSICNMRSLEDLDISNCKKLNKLPEHLGNLKSLETLYACGSDLKELPSSIQYLCKLKFLGLRDCDKLESFLNLPSNLESLDAANCTSLKSVSATFKFPLVILDLSNCQKLNEGASSIAEQIPWELKYLLPDKWPHLCIVGSEVPQWMKYRNDRGSSLSLELDAHGSSIHVIFCVVVAANPCPIFFFSSLGLYASLTDECGRSSKDYYFNFVGYDGYIGALIEMKFDFEHVFLWYCRVEHNVRKALFSADDGDGDGNLKIMKCGVHPIIENRKRKHKEDEEETPLESKLDVNLYLGMSASHSS